jgi:crotonobetaine/carnitine-CoA ligase
LKPGQNLTPVELLQYCRHNMASFMVPRYVEFMDALPKTSSLRTEKYKLKERGIMKNTWDRERNNSL